MRRLFVTLLVFTTVCAYSAPSRSLLETSSFHSAGQVSIMERGGSGIELNYTLPPSHDMLFDGKGVYAQEGRYTTSSGKTVPSVTRWVVVPPRDRVEVTVSQQEGRWLDAVGNPFDNDEIVSIDSDQHRLDPPAAIIGKPQVMRGVRMVPVTVFPLQIQQNSDRIFENSDVVVELQFSAGGGENISTRDIPISHSFAKVLTKMTLNPPADRFPRRDDFPSHLANMLILYPDALEDEDDFLDQVNMFADWKRRLGFDVEIVSEINADRDDRVDRIKSSTIRNRYDASPSIEYVVIIGTPVDSLEDEPYYFQSYPRDIVDLGDEILSSWKSDNFFVTMDGDDDLLPDVALGRILATNLDELTGAIQRTIQYEQNPYVDGDAGTDWFTRAMITSEQFTPAAYDTLGNLIAPSELPPAVSMDLMRWGRNRVEEMGYEQIDLYYVYDTEIELAEAIHDGLEEGASVAFADGHLLGAFPPADDFEVEAAETGRMNPFAVGIISWYGKGILDNFFQNVSADELQGPVAVLGLYLEGAFGYSDWIRPILGNSVSMMRFDNVYQPGHLWMSTQMQLASYWTDFEYDNPDHQLIVYRGMQESIAGLTVLGDPSVNVFTGIPMELSVDHPESYLVGANDHIYTVSDGDGNPVADALVSLIFADRGGDVADEKYFKLTDADGIAHFIMTDMDGGMPLGIEEGELMLTVQKHNAIPYTRDLEIIDPDGANLIVSSFVISNDNRLESGDSVRFRITVDNIGGEDAAEVTARFSVDNEFVSFNYDEIPIGDIDRRDDVNSPDTLSIMLEDNVPGGMAVTVTCELTSGDETWISTLEFMTSGVNLWTHSGMVEVDDNFVPGGAAAFNPTVQNIGDVGVEAVTANLVSLDDRVEVTQSVRRYRPLGRGESAEPNQPFRVRIDDNFVPGMAEFELQLESEDGHTQTIVISKHVFGEDAALPFEADEYGYICFDSGDENWNAAPVYYWRELNPQIITGHEFNGTKLDPYYEVEDSDWDSTRVIELPFAFSYYGQEFDSLVVSFNGWISMGTDGNNYYSSYNHPIPGFGSPDAQICAMWQNLINSDGRYRGVFTHYIEDEGIFVIEWSNVELRESPEDKIDLSFQILLFDPEVYETPTGDGEIVIQYKEFQMIPGQTGAAMPQYPTIGMRNLDGSGGIQYSYWNEYPTNAHPIENEFAIKFTTADVYDVGGVTGRIVRMEEPDSAIAGAVVYSTRFPADTTDENGYFSFEDIRASRHALSVSAPGFNTKMVNFEVVAGETTDLESIGMTHPEISFSYNTEVPFDSLSLRAGVELNAILQIHNSGNGQLEYEAVIVNYDGSEPTYEQTGVYNLTQMLNLDPTFPRDNVSSVVYVDSESLYYVWSRDEMIGFNRAGNVVRRFDAPEDEAGDQHWIYGLAWDGEYFWGAMYNSDDIEGYIVKFDRDGNVSAQYDTPFSELSQPTITFSPERNSLFTGDKGTAIYEMDLDGNVINDIPFNVPGRFNNQNGMVWNSFDPTGRNLYLLDNYEVNDTVHVRLIRMDVETGFWEVLNGDLTAAPGGSDEYLQYYSGMSIIHDPNDETIVIGLIDDLTDERDIHEFPVENFALREYEVGPNTSFLTNGNLVNRYGTVEPEEMSGVEMAIDVTGWEDGMVQFGIQVSHNGAGGDVLVPVSLTISGEAGVGEDETEVPQKFDLTAIYPNPFNSETRIQFSVDVATETSLAVYDLTGRQIATLYNGVPAAGAYQVTWNATNLPSGVYFIRLQSANQFKSAKVAVVK